MRRITNLAGGTAKDLDALRAIFEEAAAIVERDLPGTLVYEIFGDERTSRFVARGDYVDDDVRDLLGGFGFEIYAPLAKARPENISDDRGVNAPVRSCSI